MSYCHECHNKIDRPGPCPKCGNTPHILHVDRACMEKETFYSVRVPASMGDDVNGTWPAENGRWRNAVVVYEANHKVYFFGSDGIATYIGETEIAYNSILDRPHYGGEMMTSDTDIPDVDEAVEAEAVQRRAGDYNLQQDINAEAATRAQEDNRVAQEADAALKAEAATRKSEDDRVAKEAGDALKQEADIRQSEDARIEKAANDAVSQEAKTRQAEDESLQSQIDALAAASDVIDIVGSYSELQEYDTKDVHANDIIKVLQDETHDEATTYYRWVSNSWEYIGEQGPYYTKSEADEKISEIDSRLDGIDNDVENLTELMPAVLQETGDSEHDVMSQKAVSEKFAELAPLNDQVANIEEKQVEVGSSTTTLKDVDEALLTASGMMARWVDVSKTGLPSSPDANTFYYTVI